MLDALHSADSVAIFYELRCQHDSVDVHDALAHCPMFEDSYLLTPFVYGIMLVRVGVKKAFR